MHLNRKQRLLVIKARSKLRRLAREGEFCDGACPGWAVFSSDARGDEIQRCDSCWASMKDKLLDSEAAALPEAQALLAETLRECDELAGRGVQRGQA